MSAFYLTNEGFQKIIQEKRALEEKKKYKLKVEFPVFNQNKRTDPDYINSYEEFTFIRRRINEIKNILRNAHIITRGKKEDIVSLGSQVTLAAEAGEEDEEMTFKIVDSVETDPGHGKISRNSPLGSAILGHKIREAVFVGAPVNKKFIIQKIQ